MLKSTLAICAALAASTCSLPVAAQQNLPVAAAQTQNIKRIPLQRFEVPGTAYETVIGIAEIGPKFQSGATLIPGPSPVTSSRAVSNCWSRVNRRGCSRPVSPTKYRRTLFTMQGPERTAPR